MKLQLSVLALVGMILLVAAACLSPIPATAPPTTVPPTPTAVLPPPTPDPAAPVKAWVAALNSGDVEGTLALFDDKLSFTVFEYYASKRDQLRSIFDWFAGLETKYKITECQPDGDTVRCTLPVVDACIAASGATDGLPTKMAFTIGQDGKIQKVIGGLEGSGWNDYFSEFVYPEITWLSANSAEETKKVDSLTDRREAGVIQSKLCRAYAESLKVTPTPALASRPVLIVANEWSDDMKLMLTDEVGVMKDMLEQAGYKVVVASGSGSPIAADASTRLTPDLKLADVQVKDYAAVVFPCMAREMGINQPGSQVRVAQKAVEAGIPIAAQVGGVEVLADAGLMKGKHFAMFGEMKDVVPDGVWDGDGVVQDGKIITSGPCPFLEKMTGMADHTAELMDKLIAQLESGQ